MPKKKVSSFQRNQTKLFETSPVSELPDVRWELPDLSNEKRISLDTETTGLALWNGDIPVGMSISTEDFQYAWYIPWGHKVGFNYELDNVKRWVKDNLVDKHIDFANSKFDINMLKNIDIDLEEGNNHFHDVMHPAALLEPRRDDLDLNSLVSEKLGKKKVELDGDFKSFPMQERNSAAVWWYASYDAQLTSEIARYYAPRIADAGMTAVLDLEDAIIPAVAHMERQGAILDVESLQAWKRQAHNRYIKIVLEIYKQVGIRVEPTKPSDLAKLFHVLKIDYPLTPTGQPSITNELLQQHLDIEPIKLAYEGKQIRSLESKALNAFDRSLGKDGKIRYSLNQLKIKRNEGTGKGAATGRFSSSGGGSEINGVNIQQVIDDEKQERIEVIKDFPIRRLIKPADGKKWLSADAMQIEFRLFAHYSQSDRLRKAYFENPLIDFHDFVAANIMYKQYDLAYIKKSGLRKKIKNINFGKLYGMGIWKLANIYLHCSLEEAEEAARHYDREFPEAKDLMNAVSGMAERRGWVKTILGRIHKFGPEIDKRYYAALNYVIQGSAADIMKKKLLLLYNTRKETGFNMRFTVHDEVDGDIPDLESAIKVKRMLNEPEFKQIQIPILWSTGIGDSWMDIEDICKHELLKKNCELCR